RCQLFDFFRFLGFLQPRSRGWCAEEVHNKYWLPLAFSPDLAAQRFHRLNHLLLRLWTLHGLAWSLVLLGRFGEIGRDSFLLSLSRDAACLLHVLGRPDGIESLQETGAIGGVASLGTNVLARLLHELLHFPGVQLGIGREHQRRYPRRVGSGEGIACWSSHQGEIVPLLGDKLPARARQLGASP